MWCTRWFIPLLLLPLPAAPPYFLLLYLLSLTLHARPCFYCIILLTALFISSCYWQPIPGDSTFTNPVPALIFLNHFTTDKSFLDLSQSQALPPNISNAYGSPSSPSSSLTNLSLRTFSQALNLPFPHLSLPNDLPKLPVSASSYFFNHGDNSTSSFLERYPELSLVLIDDGYTLNASALYDSLHTNPEQSPSPHKDTGTGTEVIQLLDRCWCDFSSSGGGVRVGGRNGRGLWDTFDVTDWEVGSVLSFREKVYKHRVERLKDVERKWREAVRRAVGEYERVNGLVGESEDGGKEESEWKVEGGAMETVEVEKEEVREEQEETKEERTQPSFSPQKKRAGILGWFGSGSSSDEERGEELPRFQADATATADEPSSSSIEFLTTSSPDTPSSMPSPRPSSSSSSSSSTTRPPTSPSSPRKSWLRSLVRREYDLRPYGFSVILDFGWSSPSGIQIDSHSDLRSAEGPY